jgi:DNA-binding MarR family transcriptional regulator
MSAAAPRDTAAAAEPRHEGAAPHGLSEGDALATLLGYRVTLANVVTRKVYTRHIGVPMQLKPVEFTILMLLLANTDVTQKRLGQALDVSAPNLTIVLDGLQARELVTRVRSETDRRSQHIHLTRKGQVLARKARDVSLTMEQDLLRHLSAAEQAMLIELLHKVSRHRRV